MAAVMREIFAKAVDRPIDGVIKADDEASLLTELDEYVITDEIGHRLEQFLEAYNNYDNANGVWISGFFGSGKSHLLKMLAILLENREVNGQRAVDIFLKKDLIRAQPMLAGSLRKAVSIPSRSILFNIDQKADVISKSDVDALLAVFQKVFDEMCGYFGKQPHIAQFERDLDERGILDAFRQAYEGTAGKPWVRGREQALLERANIAKAFAATTGGQEADATDILSQYRKDTRVSIEDFANMVKALIDRQGPNFRLNFFVDEIGQYIADNTKLMTNLQTIAESLNTKCRGQAWIVVTAQQDIASVIGDMTAQQENDFSKIQARLRTRMPLNSADVAEVRVLLPGSNTSGAYLRFFASRRTLRCVSSVFGGRALGVLGRKTGPRPRTTAGFTGSAALPACGAFLAGSEAALLGVLGRKTGPRPRTAAGLTGSAALPACGAFLAGSEAALLGVLGRKTGPRPRTTAGFTGSAALPACGAFLAGSEAALLGVLGRKTGPRPRTTAGFE